MYTHLHDRTHSKTRQAEPEESQPGRSRSWRVAGCAALLLLGAGCYGHSSSSNSGPGDRYVPDASLADFARSTVIDNPFFPLEAGTIRVFHRPDAEEGAEVTVIEVLETTRVVDGVTCLVVRDRVFVEQLLIEDTHDWFAQDTAGNVWYMGEEVLNYEYDEDDQLLETNDDGSWEAGLDLAGIGELARPGYQMEATPEVGDRYNQEYYPGEAEDMAKVVALDVPLTLADGSSYLCLKIKDTNPLESGPAEYKFYAPGVGLVREEEGSDEEEIVELKGTLVPGPPLIPEFGTAVFSAPSTIDNPYLAFASGETRLFVGRSEDETETIVLDFLDETREVLGLECAVVRDRVFADGLLIEDTRDWFAQDDAGNVWYMGEEVLNYEYDEDDQLLETNDDGSWEAGQDPQNLGNPALAGFQMKAAPALGESYRQEIYVGVAEDMAYIASLDATIELSQGQTRTGCLQVLEWNPHEPGGLEYKFYQSGVGLVAEQGLSEPELVEGVGRFRPGEDSIPDFGAASFMTPTLVDNEFLPLAPGSSWTLEGESEDGHERVLMEVLVGTRDVMGVSCAVLRDRAYLEGVLIEDTQDWFAQDDAGNVWYMGEEVLNFVYDEDGTLLEVNGDGSWEAGLDSAGTGTPARPGFAMKATPRAGDSYHQEYYASAAEDMGLVAATGETIELPGGDSYAGCVRVLDWNPLEPDALEYKYFAPGVGLVYETHLEIEEFLELTAVGP